MKYKNIFNKNILMLLSILLLQTTCTTQKPKTQIKQNNIKKGFRYQVPPYMEESPNGAYSFRYDNLLIEKGKGVYDSDILIAIRHSDDYSRYTLEAFADDDQCKLRNQVKIFYDNYAWIPAGFNEKNIDFRSCQFFYKYGENTIFQRSVYLKCSDTFYVISLSAKQRDNIQNPLHDCFWKSICID